MERTGAAHLVALMMGLVLAGCGGSGGSDVVSTPPPAPVTYTKVADLTGDRTFQTAGVRYRLSDPLAVEGATQSFGNGVTVAYMAATDSYKLTAPDGTTTTVTPQNRQSSPQDGPNDRYWANQDTFEVREFVSLTAPKVDGVALSYTVLASWSRLERSKDSTFQNYLAVGGVPTVASDMPRSGNATYATAIEGTAIRNGVIHHDIGLNSSATFAADFGSNSVTTSLTLAGRPDGSTTTVPLGTVTGTGTIGGAGPGFAGSLSGGGTSGTFAGAFFGPKAVEMAYAWYLAGGNLSAAGMVAGVKK